MSEPPTIDELLQIMLLRSDNLFAELLVKEVGHRTTHGVEMPPSCTQTLWRRYGEFDALAQPGPRHRNDFAEPGGAVWSCPSPRTMIVASAPLSDRKTISVFSHAPMVCT